MKEKYFKNFKVLLSIKVKYAFISKKWKATYENYLLCK